jgi:hypothetical protein
VDLVQAQIVVDEVVEYFAGQPRTSRGRALQEQVEHLSHFLEGLTLNVAAARRYQLMLAGDGEEDKQSDGDRPDEEETPKKGK